MDFLGSVNRVLVNNTIVKGDDDLVTAFTDSQHEATIRFARQSITSELNNLTSFFNIPYERTTGSITTVAGTRAYALPSDFVQFFEDNPFLYLSTDATQRVYEYPGGEGRLRQTSFKYLTDQGFELYWYWHDTTTKQIAFHQVPDAIREWSFEYEKNVGVILSSDTMPFHTEQEAEAFSDMASRRFKFMIGDLDVSNLERDADYVFHRSTLFNLLRKRNPNKQYGKRYRSPVSDNFTW